MPLKMLANFEHVASQPLVRVRADAVEYLLQLRDVLGGDDDGEAAPVEYVGEWKVVVVCDYDRNASEVHGVPYASRVHPIAPHVDAELALEKLLGIWSFEPPIVGEYLCIVFPYFNKVFPWWTIHRSSKECKSCPAVITIFNSC